MKEYFQAPLRRPAEQRETSLSRTEMASMAMAGWLSPDLLLEHVFDRIEETAK